jgi:hypothetical protein
VVTVNFFLVNMIGQLCHSNTTSRDIFPSRGQFCEIQRSILSSWTDRDSQSHLACYITPIVDLCSRTDPLSISILSVAVRVRVYLAPFCSLPLKLKKQMSSDQKLRCALVYRLDSGSTVVLAKYDHAAQYETHGGSASDLYGGRDKSYADAVAAVIENDPPSGLAESGTIGGFKVVQSDQHQVVYGADADRICKNSFGTLACINRRIDIVTPMGTFLACWLTPFCFRFDFDERDFRLGCYYWTQLSLSRGHTNAARVVQ